MSYKRKANRLSYLIFAITNSYRKKKEMAKAEAERKKKLEIKSNVPAQTFFGPPTTPKKQPPIEEAKSRELQNSKLHQQSSTIRQNAGEKSESEEEPFQVLKTPSHSKKLEQLRSGVPMTSPGGSSEKSEEEPSQVFKTPPHSKKLGQLTSGVSMTSPGGSSPETKRKGLRRDEILAELERNHNPQSPPMKVFKLLRSDKLKQKRYNSHSTKFIGGESPPNSKLFSGDDLQESIVRQHKEELTRNDNPQSPPIKRFAHLRTEKILKAASRQPVFDHDKTAVTKDNNRTELRQNTKLKLFGMTSDNSTNNFVSDSVVEKSPKSILQLSQTSKDFVRVNDTQEYAAKEEESNGSSALPPMSLTYKNTSKSSKTPTKRSRFAKNNKNVATESEHDKANVIPIESTFNKLEGNKASLKSDNNNIIAKKEKSDSADNLANKSKSSNVSIFRGSSSHRVPTTQKYLQLVNFESSSAETFRECSEDTQESKTQEPIQCQTVNSDKSHFRSTVYLANFAEAEKGGSRQVDNNPDGSGLNKVCKENSCKFAKASESKVNNSVCQEEVHGGKEETEKQNVLSRVNLHGGENTKEAGGSKLESGKEISSDRMEEYQITRICELGKLHQLETSLTESPLAEAEITSPGSTQLNQYPNMTEDVTQNELADFTTEKDPPNVLLMSKSKPISKCFIPLVQQENIADLPLDKVTKRKHENTDIFAVTCEWLQQPTPLENEVREVQVNVVSGGSQVKSLKTFAIKINPLNYNDFNRLSNKSKRQLFANKPFISLARIPQKPEKPKKSVKRNLSVELLLGDDEDNPMQFSKKPKLIKNELKLK